MAEPIDALETIDLLYQAAVTPELWPQALHRFALAVGGMGTALIPISPGNTAGITLSPDLLDGKPEYDREWYRHDSRVLRIFRRGLTDGVCCEAELFTDDEIARDPLRQEFCRPQGMGAFAAQLVAPAPNFVVAFSVMRALDRGQFERDELRTLGLLGRHAARALVISTRLAAAGGLAQALQTALAQFDCGAFIIDRNCRILLANEAAGRLVGDGLLIDRGQLKAASRDHQAAFARWIASVLRGAPEATELQPIALPRSGGGQKLLVQAIPVGAGPQAANLPNGAAALLIVIDPEKETRRTSDKALRLLGLTPAEARLAAVIGAGHSRAEAAGALGLSELTVSDTVKRIYSKLGISRQSELVRLVERLALLERRQP